MLKSVKEYFNGINYMRVFSFFAIIIMVLLYNFEAIFGLTLLQWLHGFAVFHYFMGTMAVLLGFFILANLSTILGLAIAYGMWSFVMDCITHSLNK